MPVPRAVSQPVRPSNVAPCLVVVAKQPELGKVKTRIAAVLGDDRAVELYRCALFDTLALATSITDVAHVLTYAPATDDARDYFKQVAPAFELFPQPGATLGERLGGAFAHLLRRYGPVVSIGSDSPDLPAAFIARAFEILRGEADVVLGPADDGGYYLLGMQTMQPTLFEGIHWSTNVVAEQTRDRAADAQLKLVELPPWHDLDTVDDLRALVAPGAPLLRAFIAEMNTKGPMQ